jgi:hypothetical protein
MRDASPMVPSVAWSWTSSSSTVSAVVGMKVEARVERLLSHRHADGELVSVDIVRPRLCLWETTWAYY